MRKMLAHKIMAVLDEMPEVQRCTLYGSLANGTYDPLSDIDIEVDVSGYDDGLFMLSLTERLGDEMSIYYIDYAPSLAPEKYIVSVAVDEDDPFCMLDLCCTAEPHCTTVTRQQLRDKNDDFSHVLKLWTANLKHYVRGADCRYDIVRMASRIGIVDAQTTNAALLLEETLNWLELNAPERLLAFVHSCRRKYSELI